MALIKHITWRRFHLLLWTWRRERRVGTKAQTGIGVIVEWL